MGSDTSWNDDLVEHPQKRTDRHHIHTFTSSCFDLDIDLDFNDENFNYECERGSSPEPATQLEPAVLTVAVDPVSVKVSIISIVDKSKDTTLFSLAGAGATILTYATGTKISPGVGPAFIASTMRFSGPATTATAIHTTALTSTGMTSTSDSVSQASMPDSPPSSPLSDMEVAIITAIPLGAVNCPTADSNKSRVNTTASASQSKITNGTSSSGDAEPERVDWTEALTTFVLSSIWIVLRA